ncbi:hypothetical protein A8F94_03610 [Bacillus sp. FJAT-27225]|uniref:hypothetical protein n=1 Tax=Bacillus sp. FJAT-27225 TaxID=1743144 RepID=UPI00080C22C9|nr:hypothetical protein [Bacillus sp. FJAT-27225]OCA90969.1 hypothetical protein A8F94_03610 [Bacillus sp. FJAT-27225]
MNKRGWSDKEVEQFIRVMPKVTDDRDPREIYQNISMKVTKKRRITWIMPGFAAAAAACLLFLLFSNGSFNFTGDRQNASTGNGDPNVALVDTDNNKKTGNDENKALTMEAIDSKLSGTALYQQDVQENEKAVTLFVPDSQAQFPVPITVKVTQAEGNWVDSLKTAMASLKEEDLSLSDYYPLDVKLEEGNTFAVNVSENHPYSISGGSERMFLKVVNDTVEANDETINTIIYTTNGEPGITLKHINTFVSEEKVLEKKNRAYLFSKQEGKDIPFMVPSEKPFDNFEQAIAAMKKEGFQIGLQPSLPQNFTIQNVSVKENVLHFSLGKGTDLKDNAATLQSFEALLLTAKDFDYSAVKVENPPINKLGPFDLTDKVNVPIGANKLNIEQ